VLESIILLLPPPNCNAHYCNTIARLLRPPLLSALNYQSPALRVLVLAGPLDPDYLSRADLSFAQLGLPTR